jgi:Phosphate-selective porin O and P
MSTPRVRQALRSSAVLSCAIALLASPALAQQPPEPPAPLPLPLPLPLPDPAPLPPPPPPLPPPAVPTFPPPPAVAYDLQPAPPEAWHSGYHNGNFYIRSSDDVFRLYLQARVHVDYYDAFGPGLNELAPGAAPAHGFVLRRARFEMGGEFFQLWQWQLGAEFAPSAASNVAANTSAMSCKVNATTAAVTCTPTQSTVDAPSVSPAPTDVFVNFAPSPWANVQVGQYYVPFTLENRISDNTTAFLERALVVRNVGAPTQRDLGAMFWGESPDRHFYYAAGVFSGDGPNRPNADGRFDFFGRTFVRPFATSSSGATRWAQLGVSVHAGSRDATKVGYDMPSMTTSQGFAFWKPTYTDSLGRLIHILPSAAQEALGGDLYLPIGNFDVTGEVVYADYHTREAVDGLQLSPFTERLGALKGWGYYAQLGYWLVGDHEVLGYPSYARPIHVDLSQPRQAARHGLQVVARFEQLGLDYQGSSRGGTDDAKTPSGNVNVTSFTLGANYWATRHLRVSVNYAYYDLPAHSALTELHEVSSRVGVQF